MVSSASGSPWMWSSGVTGVFKAAMVSLLSVGRFSDRHELVQRLEDAVGAGVDGDRRAVAPEDGAVLVDHEQGALGDAVVRPIRPVALGDRALGMEVSQQGNMEVAVLRERGVAPHAVDRDPQQPGPVLLELRKDLVVQRHLVPADRTPVRGIEGEDHRLALQLPERQLLVGGDGEREIRGGRSALKDVGHGISSLGMLLPYVEALSSGTQSRESQEVRPPTM